MRILPVLDIMQGQVVRGVGGRRAEYRPIVSTLTPSTEPTAVADAIHSAHGLDEFYLADLDAIGGAAPALAVYEGLQQRGYHLWVDAGVREPNQAVAVAEAGVARIVLGLETVAGPATVREACAFLGEARVVFSLDLCDGRPLGDTTAWQSDDPMALAEQAIALGVRTILVLDLAQVGMKSGTGTESLCQRLARTHADIEIVAGGGVRDAADIRRLHALGVARVLVASALHDGRL
jgi:phosphoribosylformimino-5-aminoimidazole carboxamide ribotide isomerase